MESNTTRATKKKAARKKPPAKKRTYKPRVAKNLPPPVETNEPKADPAPERQEESGLLSGISNLFAKTPEAPEKAPENHPSIGSSISSTEPLSAEAENLLRSVPNVIGEVPPAEPQEGAETVAEDPIAALMAQVAFEPQDVQDTVCELFEWLAERFGSDHWKLSERQARMIGKPTAQLLNSVWTRLSEYIPDVLSNWCESTPGATAFIMAFGIVVVPKVTRQVSISRERAKAVPMVGPTPMTVDKPKTDETTAGGLIWKKEG